MSSPGPDNRHLKGVRFRPELLRRIERARVVEGQTFQVFVQVAVARHVEALETQYRLRREERVTARQPRGLGIRERLEAEDAQMTAGGEAASAPIAIQAPPSLLPVPLPSTTPSEILMLARTIASVPRAQRRTVLQSACDALALSARTAEECRHLADLLDREIQRIEGNGAGSILDRVRARIGGAHR